MRPPHLLLALLAAAVMGVAGCGGDDDEDGGSGALTKAELVSKADAICGDLNKRIDALPAPDSVEDVATFSEDALKIFEPAVADLKALEPPDEVEADYDRAMELLDDQIDRTKELQQAGEDKDEAKIRSVIAEGDKADEEGDKLAKKIGLQKCGED